MLRIPERGSAEELDQAIRFVRVGLALFAALAAWSWYAGHHIRAWVFTLLSVAFACHAPRPIPSLLPLYRGWMRVARVIGGAISTVLLGVFFFGIVTPVGLIMRPFRDSMDRRFPDPRTSLWRPRPVRGGGPVRYYRQF